VLAVSPRPLTRNALYITISPLPWAGFGQAAGFGLMPNGFLVPPHFARRRLDQLSDEILLDDLRDTATGYGLRPRLAARSVSAG
jgi:hypothetical protein